MNPDRENPLLRIARIAEELRQLPAVRVGLVTSMRRATYAELKSLNRLGTL
jgi:hypothetical protein